MLKTTCMRISESVCPMAAPFNRPLRGLLFNVAADHGLAPEATIRCPLRGLKSMPPACAEAREMWVKVGARVPG